MNEFKKLKEEYEKKYQKEFNKTGVFWAFSKQQWNENKTHKNVPDSEYLAIGYGGYIHKSNREKLNKFYKTTLPKLKAEFINNIKMDDLIEYELINHECYYTGSWHIIIELIKDYYPLIDVEKEIKRVYEKNKEKNLKLFEI